MKKILIAFCTFLFLTTHAFSAAIGRDGSFSVIDDHTWYNCYFKDEDESLIWMFPGNPKSGLSDGWWYSNSYFNGVYFELHTHMSQYKPPNDIIEYYEELATELDPENNLCEVEVDPRSGVKFCFQWESTEEGQRQLVRVYGTSQRVYYLIIWGDNADTKLYDTVFKSIKKS